MDMSNFEDEVRELAKQYRLKKESELWNIIGIIH
jgi:hypothetical protein